VSIIPPAKQEEFQAYFEEEMAGRSTTRLETARQRRDGSLVDVSLSTAPLVGPEGVVTGTLTIISGLSERRWAEKRLRVQHATSAILATSSTLAEAGAGILQVICGAFGWDLGEIWLADPRSKVLSRMAGWHRSLAAVDEFETLSQPVPASTGGELPGRIWTSNAPLWLPDLAEQKDFPRAAAAVKAGLHDAFGAPLHLGRELVGVMDFFSYEIQQPDGELLSLIDTIGQQIAQFIERKRAEETLRETEANLRQAQKMDAIGQLAGGVAHDFNNLLTIILGYGELALESTDKDNPLYEMISEIGNAGQRAAALTKQLLAFSRKQPLQPTSLDLNRLVSDMERMLRRLIGEDIELQPLLAPHLHHVKADPAQIQQVLLNLVVNARDAMPQGGRLTIETANVQLDPRDVKAQPDVRPGPYVLLAVTDSGCGMDEKTRARIFEPFFTTKGPGKGTGMGLATVYGIVKQSEGHITVDSKPGEGTTFRIFLPRVEQTLLTRQVDSKPSESPRGTETILLVDDESLVRGLIRRILEAHGYCVLEAGDGAEALHVSRQHSGRIHLLLTDVVMPEMSGTELARLLQEVKPETKVLFMSGYTDDAVTRHGGLEPGRPFLQKPFTSDVLTRTVRETLGPAAC
ncbi:MAG: response regulator, partial [Planctomycetes bacterium]|nr:response regulator [Planctomycetota bacterium]